MKKLLLLSSVACALTSNAFALPTDDFVNEAIRTSPSLHAFQKRCEEKGYRVDAIRGNMDRPYTWESLEIGWTTLQKRLSMVPQLLSETVCLSDEFDDEDSLNKFFGTYRTFYPNTGDISVVLLPSA